MAKPACEPTYSCPKLCPSRRKTPQKSCSFTAPCWSSSEENRPWSEINFYPLRNPPVCAFDSRARGFSTFLVHRRSSSPSSSPNQVSSCPTARGASPYQTFSDSASCLPRAATSRRAPSGNSEEAYLVDTILLNQPNHRRVSNYLLNYEKQPIDCIV